MKYTSNLPKRPEFAEMIIGKIWSGWFWPANDERGHEYWFLFYQMAGEVGAYLQIFRKKEFLEQFSDELDNPPKE